MKTFINKKNIIILSAIIGIGILGINYTFCYPTKINAYIAANVYSEPANSYFDDESFYMCIVDQYNSDNNTNIAYTENLSDEQLSKIDYLDCWGQEDEEIADYGYDISNINGIEKLTNLEVLSLVGTKIHDVDVSKNVNLVELSLDYNKNVSTLNLSKNIKLEYLNLTNTSINSIDLTNNINLNSLTIAESNITEIDLTNNVLLENLCINHTKIQDIDLSKNIELSELYLGGFYKTWYRGSSYIGHDNTYGNNISNLDLSNNNKLEIFYAPYNQLESVNLNNASKLKEIYLQSNEINDLNIDNNTALQLLNVYSNKLSSIDISDSMLLKEANLHSNLLSSIIIGNNNYLEKLSIFSNKLKTIDLTGAKNLKNLYIEENELLELDVSNNAVLSQLYAAGNNLTSIKLNDNLQYLDLGYMCHNSVAGAESCYKGNNLTSIDVSTNVNLKYLYLNKNDLETLNLYNNKKLVDLKVSNNKLTELDVSKNTELKTIYAYSNKLTNLDLSNNTKVVNLDLGVNNLSEINLSSNVLLEELLINGNKLTNIDLSKNLGLKRLYINSNQLIEIDLSKNTNLTNLGIDNNKLTKLDLSNNVDLKYLDLVPTSSEDNQFLLTYVLYTDIPIYFNVNNLLILPEGRNIQLDSRINDNNQLIVENNYIKSSTVGKYNFKETYIHDLGTKENKFCVNFIIEVIDITSDKYFIDKNNKYVSINFEDDVLYSDFISSINVSEGVSLKLFNDEEEVTGGNVEKDMILKVYYNDEEFDSFTITDEYLVIDESIRIDSDNMYFNNIDFNTTSDMILNKIDTTGEVTIKNKDNEVITGNNLIGTGSVVSIKLSKETYDYTVIIHGDVDGDGILKLSDIMKIANYTYKNKNSLTGVFEVAADFDNNGTHNLQDIMKSAKALYGGK